MSNPTSSDVHVDAALTNLSIAYIQKPSNYIAGMVFPTVPVKHQTDKYHSFDKNDWFRDDAVLVRAPATESAGSGMNLSQGTYSCDVLATHVDLSDQVLKNADPATSLDRATAEIVSQRLMIQRERQFAADYFATGLWGTDVVGTTDFAKWSDYASSDPATDVQTGKTTILQNTGMEPNTLVVSYEVHAKLKDHPLIKEQFKYTSSQSLTPAILAQFFEVEKYLVSKAAYSTSEEGATTGTYAFALGKNALLCYVAPSPSILMPSAGYNFTWAGLTGVNDLGFRISSIPIDLLRATRIEGEFAYDMKIVSSDLGYFFSLAVA